MGKLRAGLLAAFVLLTGCNHQDTQAIARVGKKIQARVEVLTGDLKASAALSWNVAADPDLASRVSARMQWDKQLAGLSIEVTAIPGGVELRGNVANLEQHRRAVMLAQSTLGVDELKDSLIEGEN
jgi:osmotically-inducible protein OsmY